MQIRNANRADLSQIVEIYNSTIPSRLVTADLEPISVSSREHWFEVHTPEHRPLWVAEQDGQMAGWLSFSDFYGRPAYRHTAEVSIYLHQDHRGKGLGKTLLQKAIDHAPELEVHTLLAFIFSHNIPSLRLFEKLGFQFHGELPRVAVMDGIERSLTLLGLRLEEHP